MKGKEKCRILKQIRQKIADENDISYITSECTHQGECRGTCPKCESELRYLEAELEKRQRLGKAVAVAALVTGIAVSSTGCTVPSRFLQPLDKLSGLLIAEKEPEPTALEGDVAYTQPLDDFLMGEIAEPDILDGEFEADYCEE